MKILDFLIFAILIIFPFSILAQADRGMQPVQINIDGKPTSLYKQSHALVIGISDYWNFDKLAGVQEDVIAVKTSLENQGFDVVVKTNLTGEQLDKTFSDFITQYGQNKDNRLLFYYAGHGYTLKTSYGDDLGYLVPVDAPKPTNSNTGLFQDKCMEMAQIEIFAKRIQSKHALFVFDACFAGSLFENTRAVPAYINYNTTLDVRQFITSGTADETALDRSIFRRQFVSALSGEADSDQDGYITGTELGSFLQRTVANYSRDYQHPQYGKIRNPNLDKGDFVFVLNPSITPMIPFVTPSIEEERVLVQYGKLELTTQISGTLYVDGNYMKQVSAGSVLTLKDLTLGEHTIKISGDETVEKSVTINPNQTVYLTIDKSHSIIDSNDEIEIFMVVESMPEYPGGEAALYTFLAENIKYPQAAKESGIQGRVFVTFVVERDGSITDVRVLRGIGGGCDEEAIRIVQSMPRWTPGVQRGKTVRVQYNLPLKFTLQKG